MNNNDGTKKMAVPKQEVGKEETREILNEVWKALQERGYNPKQQLIGYIVSNDPTYITAHNGARTLITKIERDNILEILLDKYFNK